PAPAHALPPAAVPAQPAPPRQPAPGSLPSAPHAARRLAERQSRSRLEPVDAPPRASRPDLVALSSAVSGLRYTTRGECAAPRLSPEPAYAAPRRASGPPLSVRPAAVGAGSPESDAPPQGASRAARCVTALAPLPVRPALSLVPAAQAAAQS